MPSQTDPDFSDGQPYTETDGLDLRNWIQDRFRASAQSWFDWLFEKLRLPERGQILELGCGPGDLWQKNLAALPPNLHLVLTDLSPAMLAEARRRGLSSPRFNFSVVDTRLIPFPAATFDVLIANGLLDYLPDIRAAVDEIWRVLKPGGYFFATAGGRRHLQELESLVRPFLPDASYGGDSNRFGVENGAEKLSPWFPSVQLLRYRTDLVFRQEEPILAYVLSEPAAGQGLVGEKLQAFKDFLEQELALRGEVRVTTEKGLFIASREPSK